MKTAKGLALLTILLLSLFCLVVAPFEIQQTLAARDWRPVEVEITKSRIESVQLHFHLALRVRDLETGERSSLVAVRRGDIDFNLVVVSALVESTLYADRDRYPAGTRTTAYRSPDGRHYVLEQNSIREMVILLLLACIYPAIAVQALFGKKRRAGPDARAANRPNSVAAAGAQLDKTATLERLVGVLNARNSRSR